MNNSFSIIVPAYKEEDFIRDMLTKTLEVFRRNTHDFEIIVVIDRVPNDKTFDIVQNLSKNSSEIKIIVRDGRRGIANAIRVGIKEASKSVIILMMGENSQDPTEIEKMATKMNEGYDMIFGNRFFHSKKLEKYPITKYVANLICNFAIKTIFGINSRDITNGIKVYKAIILKNMKIDSKGFEIFVELPVKAYLDGYTNFVEVPINYFGRDVSSSKFNIKDEAPKYLKAIINCCRYKKR